MDLFQMSYTFKVLTMIFHLIPGVYSLLRDLTTIRYNSGVHSSI